jgi:hypothetical protein
VTCDTSIVVAPSLNVVEELIEYVVDVPLRSSTVIDESEIAVTTPPAMVVGAPGGAGVAVAVSVESWVAADASPAPPATSPMPSAVVATTRFAAVFLCWFIMFLSLRRSETISNHVHRARRR